MRISIIGAGRIGSTRVVATIPLGHYRELPAVDVRARIGVQPV